MIIAFLWIVVIRGTNNPLVVEKTSKTLVALGVFGTSEILTFCWAFNCKLTKHVTTKRNLGKFETIFIFFYSLI